MSGQSRPPHQHRLSVTIQWQNLESNVSNSRVLSVITISHHLSWKLRCWNNSSVLPGIKFHHGCNVLIHDTGWKEKTPATENPCTGMIASTRIHKLIAPSLRSHHCLRSPLQLSPFLCRQLHYLRPACQVQNWISESVSDQAKFFIWRLAALDQPNALNALRYPSKRWRKEVINFPTVCAGTQT